MKCPRCTAETRILATRTPAEDLIVRSHICEAGHRFRSVQVLESVYKAQRKILDGARARVARGTAKRRATTEKRERIRALLAEGLSQAEVARRTGFSQCSVSRAAAALGIKRPSKPARASWIQGL